MSRTTFRQEIEYKSLADFPRELLLIERLHCVKLAKHGKVNAILADKMAHVPWVLSRTKRPHRWCRKS